MKKGNKMAKKENGKEHKKKRDIRSRRCRRM
jgi:hypothetical protein